MPRKKKISNQVKCQILLRTVVLFPPSYPYELGEESIALELYFEFMLAHPHVV